MDKIVLGFSGGVDSSVAACLLMRAGYEVHGLYLDTGGTTSIDEVRASAALLGFSLRVYDAREELERHVCRPFALGYSRGETPNPCILCNPAVKFRALCSYADQLGAERVATGHYVRTEGGALYKGRPKNDQSYMLCRLSREQAARFVAPLGGFEKAEVRALAEELGVPAAHKPDSMEICFIPEGGHAAWMAARGEAPSPGNVIYNGRVVGRHQGIHGFTLGQRRHLGFAAGKRVYVSELRPDTGEVVLSDGDGLFVTRLEGKDMNWLIDAPSAPVECQARVRHSRELFPAVAAPLEGGGITVTFPSPVRAPTPGQSAALYDGERLLGGAIII